MNEKERHYLLVADENKEKRTALTERLGTDYDLLETASRWEAWETIKREQNEIVLILLGTLESKDECFALLNDLQRNHVIEEIPVIVMAPESESAYLDEALKIGATDYISRTMSMQMIRRRIENTIRLYARQNRFLKLMTAQNERIKERMAPLTNMDELTGCHNYDGFRVRAKQLIGEHPGEKYALWVMDIRNFRFFNEAFGYEIGDRLLRYWVRNILQELKTGETVGRIVADQLALLLRSGDEEENRARFERIAAGVHDYQVKFGNNYQVELICGIYLLQEKDMDSPDIAHMLNLATNVNRRLKGTSGNQCAFYSEQIWESKVRQIEICQSLTEAIRSGDVMAWIQPQYNYEEECMIGAEVLCRWNHRHLGWLSPGEFIPVLEHSGQIPELDAYIWEEACRLLRKWLDEGEKQVVPLSVNISRIDVMQGNLFPTLTGLLDKYRLSPDMLRLEITESAYIGDTQKLIQEVQSLRDYGFMIEMDDFGSGFSSLSMLQNVPIDLLKMDLRFLTGRNKKSSNIVSAVIHMAHAMELPVIAEGVETVDQADFLKLMGCRMMQGFYFAKPVPVAEYEQLLENVGTQGQTAVHKKKISS